MHWFMFLDEHKHLLFYLAPPWFMLKVLTVQKMILHLSISSHIIDNAFIMCGHGLYTYLVS